MLCIVYRSQNSRARHFINEYLLRAEIVGWRIETVNEIPRKKIMSEHLIFRIRIDEYVGEWSGRIPDITAFSEQAQDVSDLFICLCRIDVFFLRVDGRIISLIRSE